MDFLLVKITMEQETFTSLSVKSGFSFLPNFIDSQRIIRSYLISEYWIMMIVQESGPSQYLKSHSDWCNTAGSKDFNFEAGTGGN